MLDDEGILLFASINIVGALLYLVVAIGDSVKAAEVEDAGVECAEGVALNHNVFVIATVLLLADAAVICYVSIAPCLTTVQTVVEHIVAYLHVAYTRLLVPITTVALEEN